MIGWIVLTIGGILLTAAACQSWLFEKVLGRGIRSNYRFWSQLGLSMGDEELYVKAYRVGLVFGGIVLTTIGIGSAVTLWRR